MRKFVNDPVGEEAIALVQGERQESYGDPLVNYGRMAKFVEAIMDTSCSRRQAMHLMIGLKMCRDLTTPLRDNEVDICGYAHLLQMDREASNEEEEDF